MSSHSKENNLEPMLKSVAKGGLINFAGSIIGRVLRFVLNIILSRVLGASSYGLYSIGQSIIDIFTNIGLLGDGRGFVRFAAIFIDQKDTAKLKGAIRGYIIICFIISLLIASVLFLGAEYIANNFFHHLGLITVIKIFAVSFPFYIFALIVIPIGSAFQRMEYKVIVQETSQPIINTIVLLVLFFFGLKLYGAVGGFLITSILTAILGFYLLRGLYPPAFLKSEPQSIYETKKLITYSLPLVGISFSYYLLYRLDRILLGVYCSPFEVGIYSAISSMAFGVMAFSSIFDACLAPVIAQLYHTNKKEELKMIFNCTASWGVILAFIPSIILIIFNKQFVALFGKDFLSAYLLLIVFSVSCLIETVPGQLRQLFQMSSHHKLEFFNSILMIILNIVFNLILIPRHGALGAASAFFLTITAISIIRTIELKIFFGFLPFSSRHIRLLIHMASALLIAFLTIKSERLTLKVAIASLILSTFLWHIIKFRTKEDKIVLDSIKSRFFKFK